MQAGKNIPKKIYIVEKFKHWNQAVQKSGGLSVFMAWLVKALDNHWGPTVNRFEKIASNLDDSVI